ncbi:ATP-binding protein [Streptomyces sp. NBC_01236]|uniref:ATP-binding protein n=1 Tax=Streptomyces sp. NBC_01236 TaxID=2903789 RepID=UPI002E0EB7A1|nr:ATP-binding protein [Streptomyces sp. NBC_01236]
MSPTPNHTPNHTSSHPPNPTPAAGSTPPAPPTPYVPPPPHLPDHPTPLPFTAPWQYELRFPRDPRSPRIVRITLRAVLSAHGLDELTDRAELLACELATNSVRYTNSPAAVRLHWRYPVLRVIVHDMSPDLPQPGPVPPDDAVGGRGLLILDAVADRWGGCSVTASPYERPGLGKTIWFELSLDRGDGPPPPTLAAA